jgi:hypothetical protein
MAQPSRILRRNVRRDRDVTGETVARPRHWRKRQHVGRTIFFSKAPIEFAQLAAARDQDAHLPPHPGQTSCTRDKPRQRRLTKSRHSLSENNHRAPVVAKQRLRKITASQNKQEGPFRRPPARSLTFYSLELASMLGLTLPGATFFCGAASSAPFVFPPAALLASSSDNCSSATLFLCSS